MAWIVAAVLVGWACVRLFAGYPAPPLRPRRLGAREWATLDAVAEALFPAGGPIAPSGVEAGVADYVDRLLDASQPRQRTLMRALFFLIEHATIFFPAPGGPSGFRRFSSLDVGQRQAVIQAWQDSGWFPRRLVFTSLRAICTMGYFASPEVLRTLRLAPYAFESPVVEADLLYPPIGQSRSAIDLSPADLSSPGDPAPLDLDGPLLEGYAGERA